MIGDTVIVGKHPTLLIILVLVGFPVYALAQGRATGTCSQLINGKYYQVPCAQPPSTASQPPGNPTTPAPPTTEELDRQARERQLERERKEKERKQQEDAASAAEKEAEAADFIKRRDEATSDLKGLDSKSGPKLKDAPGIIPCLPRQDTSVVDLCFPENKSSDSRPLADESLNAEERRIINGIKDLAKRQRWSAEEQARLSKALYSLRADGRTVTIAEIQQTWNKILRRRASAELLRDVRSGNGSVLPSAGRQIRFQDCAVFALANSARLPYSVAATRAAELIRQAEWRSESERLNPQRVIETEGLIGGEMIMLAEAFGRAEIISSSNFAGTLLKRKPIMVGVSSPDGRGSHEVVLTKTFQHQGETWYELMDSNQGPFRKLYLSHTELDTILLENGVAFSPEPGTTPKLLR